MLSPRKKKRCCTVLVSRMVPWMVSFALCRAQNKTKRLRRSIPRTTKFFKWGSLVRFKLYTRQIRQIRDQTELSYAHTSECTHHLHRHWASHKSYVLYFVGPTLFCYFFKNINIRIPQTVYITLIIFLYKNRFFIKICLQVN